MQFLRRKNTDKAFNRCAPLPESWPQLQQWYVSTLGERLAAREMALLNETLANLFGYHLLQLGRLSKEDWLAASRISHCVVMDFIGSEGATDERRFYGLPDQLPVQTDSMDVLVLPHTLEFSRHPHAILRDAERALIPEGHLVMLVFNPWSVWALWRWVLGWSGKLPWCGRFLSAARVRDWMELLGFDVVQVRGYFYRPPLQHKAIMRHLRFWERLGQRLWPVFGAANLIVAKKRVVTMTPIRPRWRPQRKRVATAGLAEPFQHKDKHEQDPR